MTQTILAIPINDMVSSEITASGSTQRQLLHHSLNNVSQKNVNRQQLGQTYCRPQLPLDRYFQHRTADDETNASDNGHNGNTTTVGACFPRAPCSVRSFNSPFRSFSDDTATNSATAADNQRRKWQHADLNSKKHSFVPVSCRRSRRSNAPRTFWQICLTRLVLGRIVDSLSKNNRYAPKTSKRATNRLACNARKTARRFKRRPVRTETIIVFIRTARSGTPSAIATRT